jgi:hypothetical protein
MPQDTANLTILEKLYSLAEKEAQNEDATDIFEPIGLILMRPLMNGGYYCTPTNSSMFAHTGGDGVHFSFLHVDGNVTDTSPIVMTVPLGHSENVFVGANLFEFLCLGCQHGYFDLQELGYNFGKYPKESPVNYRDQYLEHRSPGILDERLDRRQYLLKLLTVEFSLKPWNNIQQRLDELQKLYLPLVILPSRDKD